MERGPEISEIDDAIFRILDYAEESTDYPEFEDQATRQRVVECARSIMEMFQANQVSLELGGALITNGNYYTEQTPLRILIEDADQLGAKKAFFIADCFRRDFTPEDFQQEYERVFGRS